MQLGLALLGRVEQVLQFHVQCLCAGGAKLCGAQHLNIPDGVKAVTPGQPGGDKVAHQPLRGLTVGLQKEEVIGLAALLQRLAGDDVVGVFHDEAALCLPEDLVQADGGHAAGANDLAEDVARTYTGQLVGIAYHNNTAGVAQRRNKRLKQLDIHHAHLVQNDHVTLEQVFVVMDKADHAAGVVHLQQAVDGAGLAAGQLAEPLGGASGGRAQGYPLGLIFQQLQNSVDSGGLAGAGAAGEHKAVFCHGLADGFPLQGGVGKALRQLQDLDVFIQIPGRVLAALCQQIQPVGNVLLRCQQIWQVDIGHGIEHFYTQFFRFDAVIQCTGQLFRRLVDKVGGSRQQLRPGQTGVSVARVVAQSAQQGSFQPLGTVPFHVVILGDTVRMTEIQLQRLPAQQIGV